MTGFRFTEAPELVLGEELGDGEGAILMHAVGAPRGDNHFAAIGGIEEGLIIFGAVGIVGPDHLLGIGGAKAKDIGHEKTVEALAFGKPADAREGRIKLLLIGGARVETDPHDQPVAEQRIDPMQERVTVASVG